VQQFHGPKISISASIKAKTPVVEHKGLFSSGVVFLAYAPHLQCFRVLRKSTFVFSICLASGEGLVDEEKNHQNAGNAAE
jgi:hypothetical protein